MPLQGTELTRDGVSFPLRVARLARRGNLNRRGSALVDALGWLAAAGAAVLTVVQTIGGTSLDVIVSAGIVVTLLLLVLGKIVANERVIGRVEGRSEENSKRDDAQDRLLEAFQVQLGGYHDIARKAKHDAVAELSPRISEIEARVRKLEIDGGGRRTRQKEEAET